MVFPYKERKGAIPAIISFSVLFWISGSVAKIAADKMDLELSIEYIDILYIGMIAKFELWKKI